MEKKQTPPLERQTGLGVDAYGGQVIDPTKNVSDLVKQEKERSDDLRVAEGKFRDYQVKNLEKIMNLHIMYQDKLTAKESQRIDAVNSVAAAAVSLANEKTNTTANLLAAQLTQITTELSKRISTVETNMNVSLGKERVSDPLYSELLSEVKGLRDSRSGKTGETLGMKNLWGFITVGIGIVAVIVTLILKL